MNSNKYKSPKIIALSILMALTLVMSAALPLVNGFIAGQTDVALADSVVLEGVAGNDNYDTRQYSYKVNQWAYEKGLANVSPPDPDNNWYNAKKSLRLGLTEYGEFATTQSLDSEENAGIAYGANVAEWENTESFASDEIDPKYWIQGWHLYLNYSRAGVQRQLLAYALYSDLSIEENGRSVYSWVGNCTDLHVGTLTPSGVKILYDSGRLVVARTSTLITEGKHQEDVAKVTFTVVYNKDTKYAIVYKDVKILLDPKILDSIDDFAFSERYEIDLARLINTANRAYIHYYRNFSSTVYQHPLTGESTYDALQAFDAGRQYIFFAGYWPNATEYSVYSPLVPAVTAAAGGAVTRVLPNGFELADIPSPPAEPSTPWVIVQWRYNYSMWPNLLTWLAKETPKREIRFVEILGMTDYNTTNIQHPALDVNATDAINQLDAEVWFMLDRVFNPEDLAFDESTDPFMWIGLGQSAATTDSGGGALLTDIATDGSKQEPFILFDRNDTMFPWTGGFGMKGTIPYGLTEFGGQYYETFDNVDEGTGSDPTEYCRTMLKGFAFGKYDDDYESPPQPISGGDSYSGDYWYPSKNPLSERWDGYSGGSYSSMSPWAGIEWNPNGIISLGGMKANGLTRYFNDWNFGITREGTEAYALVDGGVVTGTAPTSCPPVQTFDYFPISTWNSSMSTFGYAEGHAVISLARDINGTRGLTVYGWDGRDTFWAAAWAGQWLDDVQMWQNWVPAGTVSIILKITYAGPMAEPTNFTIVKALGTITEFGSNAFASDPAYGFDKAVSWTGGICLPSPSQHFKTWWHSKVPTDTTAKVDYDL